MNSEYLIEKMKEEREWTQIDPFEEFISGLDDASVFILASALELYEDIGLEMWNVPIAPRTRAWKQTALAELFSRDVPVEKIMFRTADELLTSMADCPHCYKGMIYGQIPEDGPECECLHCWPQSEAHAMYIEYLERRNTQ